MTSQPEFIKAFKEADPEASREDIDKAWKEEKQREEKRLAAEREEKRLAAEAEREHELAKLRIAQQRGGDGKLFVSCFAFGFP
jgi:ribosomal protein L9